METGKRLWGVMAVLATIEPISNTLQNILEEESIEQEMGVGGHDTLS